MKINDGRSRTGRVARSLVGLAALVASVAGAAGIPASAEEEPEYDMKLLQFVMLERPESAPALEDEESARLQQEHLAYLESVWSDGRALVVGPIEGGGTLRGIVVLDVGDVATAEALMAEDPFVRAGSLTADVRPWYAARNVFRKGDAFLDLESVLLGFLERPADAPELDEPRLAEIQRGHLANIEAMAEAGALAVAGPLTDDRPLRGLLVFTETDRERVLRLASRDPAIAARRLELELLPWWISKGSFGAP